MLTKTYVSDRLVLKLKGREMLQDALSSARKRDAPLSRLLHLPRVDVPTANTGERSV